ncbi:MAG: hypothetical protein HYX99_00750 [Chloroflexi bacterium]|nr:hypothetical protein [Chloroflexota bacterium]
MNLRQFRWLVSHIKCNNCGENLKPRDVQVLGQQEDLWFLSVICAGCHTQSLIAAMVQEGRQAEPLEAAPELGEPVTADDVLDIHSFLDTFDGDFRRLLAEHKKD